MFEFNQSGNKIPDWCKKIDKAHLACVEMNSITQSKLIAAQGSWGLSRCRIMKFCQHLMEAACFLLAFTL